MKVLACASYDYMKLMVLELQQQLAEADEVARVNGSSTAVRSSQSSNSIKEQGSNAGGRSAGSERTNPFNQAGPAKTPKKTWTVYHGELGRKIRSDHEIWSRSLGSAGKTVSVQ